MRLATDRGPVHVFKVGGKGTVIYVHGFLVDVDEAVSQHRLLQQFTRSGVPAVFLVPEAPKKSGDPVRWKNLGELLRTVEKSIGQKLPMPVVAVGHSDAFETLVHWLGDPRLVHVTLLDALYGFRDRFRDWANLPGHTMDLVSTQQGKPLVNAEAIWGDLEGVVARKEVPGILSSQEKKAKTLYMVSSLDHFALVTSGLVIPSLLRRSPIREAGLGGLLVLGALALGLYFLWR